MSQSNTEKPAAIDEDLTKPSRDKQWHEQSCRPVIINRMNQKEINMHRSNLLAMYGAADDDITIHFKKLTDKNDEDYDDCLELIYKLKCVRFGKEEQRDIYRIKIPIPVSLKQRAEALRAEKEAQSRIIRALPAPVYEPEPEIVQRAIPMTTSSPTTASPTIINQQPTSQPTSQPTTKRPAVRKPAVRKVAAAKK